MIKNFIDKTAVLVGNCRIEGSRIAAGCELENSSVMNCRLGRGVRIINSHLDSCEVAAGCVIGPFSRLKNAKIGQEAQVLQSSVEDSFIGRSSSIGPFTYLRKNARIGAGCRVGDFVEIKNSTLGDGSKCAHLAYVGDASVGKGCNIGCGTVFANFNGSTKSKTTVGDHTFIGANTNLVAPLKVGKHCYIAAGTTVRHDIPDGQFVCAKTEVITKPNRLVR